jgi:hypothetical protein
MTQPSSARRVVAIGAVVLGLVAAAGCGSAEPQATGSNGSTTSTRPTRPAGPVKGLLLAQFSNGVGAVAPGYKAAIWNDPAAVAAVDGSAVFSVRRHGPDRLVRLDRHTGAVVTSWRLPRGFWVNAVAPDGRWVALTDRRPSYRDQSAGAFTEIVVFDPSAGTAIHRLTLSGNLQPEAFSVDGKLIFALHYQGDHYRVQTIELATGEQYDTTDRDKSLTPEDMHGAAVRGVLSSDRTLLATLYRNPGNDEEPAFVHVLDLEYGWSYCADLPQPFGTGPEGSDVIELTAANTVVVAANAAKRIAEIQIEEVHTAAQAPVDVAYRDGTVAPAGSAFRSTPGFGHVIAPVPV